MITYGWRGDVRVREYSRAPRFLVEVNTGWAKWRLEEFTDDIGEAVEAFMRIVRGRR